MSWSSVLGRLRPPALGSMLKNPLMTISSPFACPRACTPATNWMSPPGRGWVLGQGQQRGMAVSNRKHKKIIKMAKGYSGRGKNVFKIAIQKVEKALQQAYRDRKNKKRDFRRLWIERINAGVRQHGMRYSVFVNQANKAHVELNRKVLADMAVTEPYSFRSVVETVKAHGSA
ncbi:unnamed protein product [Choristocarpus tenellus]